MNVTTIHPLPDGSLSLDAIREQRIAKIADMAAHLVSTSSYLDHGDAIIMLLAEGYSTFEVHALVSDARQCAIEHVVAMEMSQ